MRGFDWLDYAAVVVYLASLVAGGMYFMRRQNDTTDFFLGGRGFHWLPVAISMFTSLFSAISYVSVPAEAYNHGMMLFLFSVSVILGVPPAVLIFVRLFRRLSLITAYEYLERRFNLRVRLAASFLFLLLRSFYLGVVLCASGVAMRPATGWPVWATVAVVGSVATIYTAMGGISSVIWIDVMQFIVLLGGILLVVGQLAMAHPDGLSGIWSYAAQHGHTFNQLTDPSFYSFDPYVRISFWVLVVSAVFTKLGYAGADQISIQRYLSTRSERDASRSLIWGTLLGIPVMFLLYFTGLALFWFYAMHPEKALPGMRGDHALALFVSHELPSGVGGLVIAGILAAVMTTIDSGLNSLATCTITDFYGRIGSPRADDASKLYWARVSTVAWGAVSIASAGLIMWLFGADSDRNPLIVVTNVTIGFFTGILLGIFLLGVLTQRANASGVLIGAVAGLVAATAITVPFYFCDLPPDAPRLSFLWINVIGCLTTIVVGYGASLLTAAPTAEKLDGLTYWDPAVSKQVIS
jgi:SSS family transporter